MFSQYYILSGNLARIHFGKIGKDITLAKKNCKKKQEIAKISSPSNYTYYYLRQILNFTLAKFSTVFI